MHLPYSHVVAQGVHLGNDVDESPPMLGIILTLPHKICILAATSTNFRPPPLLRSQRFVPIAAIQVLTSVIFLLPYTLVG